MADYLSDSGELEQASEVLWATRRTLDPWEDGGGEEKHPPHGGDEIMERMITVRPGSPPRLSPPPSPATEDRLEDILERHVDLYTPSASTHQSYTIATATTSSDDDHLIYGGVVPDPIRLRGVGGTTLFGLNSRFDDDFPSYLVGKVAPEEFQATIARINSILHKSIPFNLKCFLCGCLCCCCTLGISMGPVLYLSKRTKTRLEKVIAQENWRLYNKLGLNIKLHKEQCEGTNLREYVLYVEFLPKQCLYYPD